MKREGKRCLFDEKEQAYILVTEADANVTYIPEKVREKWGPKFTVVTSKGLAVVDEPDTQRKIKTILLALPLECLSFLQVFSFGRALPDDSMQ